MDLALVMLSGTIKILTIPAERMIVHMSCPLRGGEIKRIQFGEILAQRIMGYLGQVTEAFGFKFPSQKLNSNGTLQRDTREFNAAFSQFLQFLLCNLRYKCPN